MSIVESDGPPSWSLDASETGESTKCPWVGVVDVTAGEFWRHRKSNQLKISSPGKKTVRLGKYDINYVWLRDILKFKVFK